MSWASWLAEATANALWVTTTQSGLVAVYPLLLLDALYHGRDGAVARLLRAGDGSSRRDLILPVLAASPLHPFVVVLFSLGFAFVTAQLTSTTIEAITGAHLSIASGRWYIDVPLHLFLYSLVEYWNHRLLHTRWLWPLHRMHHSATHFNVLTSRRNHPALYAWEPLIRVWLGAVLQVHPAVFVVYGFHQWMVHTDLPWTFGWVGRWVLVSPMHHRIHHSRDTVHHNKNFSTTLILFDHLFGTYSEDYDRPIELGLEEEPPGQTWLPVELLRDVGELIRGPGERLGALGRRISNRYARGTS